jgi:5'-phosphate synthase pdxT subunit
MKPNSYNLSNQDSASHGHVSYTPHQHHTSSSQHQPRPPKTIGVLAVQGAFAEHAARLTEQGFNAVELRQAHDLQQPLDGLVLPGGESTTQAKLINDLGMRKPLQKLIEDGIPTLGTCAGLILLAEEVDAPSQAKFGEGRARLGTFPITAARNAYGRQLGSFHTQSNFNGSTIPLTFIRAPFIAEASPEVEVLCEVEGRIVAARYKNQVVCAFHPELDNDNTVYDIVFSD